MVLIGLLAAYATAGSHSTGLVQLGQAGLPVHFQMWAFPLVFVGFGILAGMWPFHTWAPTGHVAAPTAASMLLAGVVMKLGAYGCLRVAMSLFPHGMDPWGFSFIGIGSWRDVFAVLAVIGIVYGALVALVQSDFKFVIGYSSVSHMGFVLLGLMTLNQIGMTGAVLQMFSHGVLAGLLFAIVGRMVYDRTHTRQLAELERMHLSRRMPFVAGAFVIAGMASMGLPGFSRICGGTAGAGGRVEGESVVDRGGRRGHRGGRCVYVARAAEGLLLRCEAHRRGSSQDGLARSGSDHLAGGGRVLAAGAWPVYGWGCIRGFCWMRLSRR